MKIKVCDTKRSLQYFSKWGDALRWESWLIIKRSDSPCLTWRKRNKGRKEKKKKEKTTSQRDNPTLYVFPGTWTVMAEISPLGCCFSWSRIKKGLLLVHMVLDGSKQSSSPSTTYTWLHGHTVHCDACLRWPEPLLVTVILFNKSNLGLSFSERVKLFESKQQVCLNSWLCCEPSSNGKIPSPFRLHKLHLCTWVVAKGVGRPHHRLGVHHRGLCHHHGTHVRRHSICHHARRCGCREGHDRWSLKWQKKINNKTMIPSTEQRQDGIQLIFNCLLTDC